tara:strand:+ start:417 stop:587 length:171 start_codon:yes stop_codon:yes gene_type:complete
MNWICPEIVSDDKRFVEKIKPSWLRHQVTGAFQGWATWYARQDDVAEVIPAQKVVH